MAPPTAQAPRSRTKGRARGTPATAAAGRDTPPSAGPPPPVAAVVVAALAVLLAGLFFRDKLALGFASLWQAYNDLLAVRPLLAKVAVGVVFTFLGDLLAQLVAPPAAAAATTAAAEASAGELPRSEQGTCGASQQQHGAVGPDGGDTSKQRCGPDASSRRSAYVVRLFGGWFTYDYGRAFRFGLYSALVGTPLAAGWFNLLDRLIVTSPVVSAAVASTAASVVLQPSGVFVLSPAAAVLTKMFLVSSSKALF